MERLGIAARPPGPFRLSHDARDRRTFKGARPLAQTLVTEPAQSPNDFSKLLVVGGERGQPFPDLFAAPPTFLAQRREAVAIKPCANEVRRFVRERIVREQRERAGIVLQKFGGKVECPWVF